MRASAAATLLLTTAADAQTAAPIFGNIKLASTTNLVLQDCKNLCKATPTCVGISVTTDEWNQQAHPPPGPPPCLTCPHWCGLCESMSPMGSHSNFVSHTAHT
eukprot:gene28113-14479_t